MAEFNRLVDDLVKHAGRNRDEPAAEDGMTPALRRHVLTSIAKKSAKDSAALDAKFPGLGRIGQS